MIDTGCDECGAPAVFIAYAAYDHAPQATHPLVARYPNPMIRSCAEHIGEQMAEDSGSSTSTKQWVVRCAD